MRSARAGDPSATPSPAVEVPIASGEPEVTWRSGDPTREGQLAEASRMQDYLVIRRDDVRRAMEAARARGDTIRVGRLQMELDAIEQRMPEVEARVRELSAGGSAAPAGSPR